MESIHASWMSADGSSGHLGAGVAETLINALSKVPGFTLSARTSAFSLCDQQNDLRAIGRQLGVSAILTGSIQRAGDQSRVTARAVRIANDSILWSQYFDRPASDSFAVQDEVARAVVAALRPTLDAVPDSTRNVSVVPPTLRRMKATRWAAITGMCAPPRE